MPEPSCHPDLAFEPRVGHLCDACRNDFATCGAHLIVWGIDLNPAATGADVDMVLECDGFLPSL